MPSKKIIISIVILVVALLGTNIYRAIEVKNLELNAKQLQMDIETNKREQAEAYAKRLEFQQELTKSSIQTVTEETNHYMYINEKLQDENDEFRKNIDSSLRDNNCANSDIPNANRNRMLTK